MLIDCKLTEKKCIPCESGTPPLSAEEVNRLGFEIKDWQVADNKLIMKDFKFKNFKEALKFVNEVGEIAEKEGHHPDINLHNWNRVQITLSTHASKGLSENDFILAAKIDKNLGNLA